MNQDLRLTIECPVCRTKIPVSDEMKVTDSGVSISATYEAVDKHLEVHRACACWYVSSSGDRVTNPSCDVHATFGP